jgi:transposase
VCLFDFGTVYFEHGGVSDAEPTVEVPLRLLAERDALIAQLQATVARLEGRVAELEVRLGMNSTNSHLPPSSDGPGRPVKPAPRSLRGKSGRKPGGQPGHPGAALSLTDDPDEVVRHAPDRCRGCGTGLRGRPVTRVVRRQVFELPQPAPLRVTEHQLVAKRCWCGVETVAAAPAGVDAPVSYGPRLKAVTVYVQFAQFCSRLRTAQAVRDLFGVPISAGTVSGFGTKAAAGLAGFITTVTDLLRAAPVAGFDETSMRVAGGNWWVHTACTPELTLLTVHPARGCDGADAAGVLPHFEGVAVHDAWAPYDTYEQATHALCGAHVLRELQAVTDTAATGGQWAARLADTLRTLKHAADEAREQGQTAVDPAWRAAQVRAYTAAAQVGFNVSSARSNEVDKKHNALARRLLDRKDDILRFAYDLSVPFDNNRSEQSIRMVKVRQKISGTMRIPQGAQDFVTIRSYLQTAAKQGKNALDVLIALFEGRPWLPSTT